MPATGIEVISNFFQVLGVQPLKGRLFRPEESRAGAHPVALLEYAYWKRQFAGDPNIVGKEIDLNNTPTTVVGVLPQSFDFGAFYSPGERVDLLVPLDLDKERMWGNIIAMTARLKPGVTLGRAQAEANIVVTEAVLEQQVSAVVRIVCQQAWGFDRAADAEGLCERAAAAVADRAVVGGGHDPADRVREFVEPAAGAGGGAQQGVRDAQRAGREPRTDGAAADDRKPDFVDGRRDSGIRLGVGTGAVAGASGIAGAAAAEHAAYRRTGAGVDGADRVCGGGAVRADAGIAHGGGQSAGVAQGFRTRVERGAETRERCARRW